MKLVVIICVEELSDLARDLLKKTQVPAFSETDIKGTHIIEENTSDNWFADKHALDNSRLFFTFCNDQKAAQVLEAVTECKLHTQNEHVHAFQLNIEKHIP